MNSVFVPEVQRSISCLGTMGHNLGCILPSPELHIYIYVYIYVYVSIYIYMYVYWASQVAQWVKNPPVMQEMQETRVRSWVRKIPWRKA